MKVSYIREEGEERVTLITLIRSLLSCKLFIPSKEL